MAEERAARQGSWWGARRASHSPRRGGERWVWVDPGPPQDAPRLLSSLLLAFSTAADPAWMECPQGSHWPL